MTANEETRMAQMVDRYERRITELERRPTWKIVKKACRTPDDEFDCSAEYCTPESGCPLVRGVVPVENNPDKTHTSTNKSTVKP
jgi:hypothetical protein